MARRGKGGDPGDWVTRAADDALRHAGGEQALADGKVVTVASGASPSGPVHLGNLREFLTVHFVAEELRRREVPTRHLHSWDDYDRFRKVPAGVDPSFEQHIGRPLSDVPDPDGEHASWAERYQAPIRAALAEMGVAMEEVSQTRMYRSGAYREQIVTAARRRDDIEWVLAQYRTKQGPVAESEQEAAALANSVAHDEETESHAVVNGDPELAKFPYKPWCTVCGRDTTALQHFDDDALDLAYHCTSCGHEGSTNLATEDGGKLVWKVDWPMRWAYEGVDFEPGGADHATPGSSYTVGKEIVAEVFGGRAPSFVAYSFVGAGGQVKMSSSRGSVPTATDALQVLEAPMLRWLYVRRQPKQSFTVDFGPEVVRLYDEWDALGRKAGDPNRRDAQVLAWERAVQTTSAGRLPTPEVTVPFRVLSSVADVTAGSPAQISRIVTDAGHPHDSVAQLEPRLTRAMTWMRDFVPETHRTTVRAEPDRDRLAALSEQEVGWLDALVARLPEEPDVATVSSVVYGVPKLDHDLALEDRPTDEAKSDQRAFFTLLYQLLVDAEQGPRLPTLLVALGTARVRALLGR